MKSSGYKNYQKDIGSRNNSPTMTLKTSMNSSFGFLKLNLSLEEGKMAIIREKAKNQGLYVFDKTNSIRLARRAEKLKLSKGKFTGLKLRKIKPISKNSLNVTHDTSPVCYPRNRNISGVSEKTQSFLTVTASKGTKTRVNSINTPTNISQRAVYKSTSSRLKRYRSNNGSIIKQPNTTQNSPNGKIT
jgi:hypothetical protein